MFKIPCQKQLTLCNFLTVCGNTAIQKYQNAVKTSPIYLTYESNSCSFLCVYVEGGGEETVICSNVEDTVS
jgi:hypothetical protein